MKTKITALCLVVSLLFIAAECTDGGRPANVTAKDEQAHTEINQQRLLKTQPPPDITWSLERDNLIKRFKLENDRSVMFYMYVFIEGIPDPIGYYEVNKISSVNSQLTNPAQILDDPHGTMEAGSVILPSPAEDGSYGSNGDGVFGFTPEDIYIEHNMKYICSTVPLSFKTKPVKLNIISIETKESLKKLMDKIEN